MWRHPLLTSVAGALVSALIGGVFLLVKSSGDVVLIGVDKTQGNPFVPGNHDPSVPGPGVVPPLPDVPPRDPNNRQRIPGGEPGGHGRSGDGVSCDVSAHLKYLTDPAHAAAAAAWAGVIGIQPADIPGYVNRLTPVRLRFDTRVTNYDYKDGHADGFQAALQAGTAVLVDDQGVPRMKCNCGNPLMEPNGPADKGSVAGYAKNPQDAWDRFDPGQVVTFTGGTHVDRFVLVDLDDGQAYQRGVGSNGRDAPIGRGDPACGILAVTTNCGGPGPQATPADAEALDKAVRRLTDAVRNKDCKGLFDLMSARAITQLGLNSAESLSNCQQSFQALESFGGITINEIKVLSQTGARAEISITATISGQSVTEQDHMVRENGNWKVDIAG
ncbi:DUF6777 domain-containing protein [Actinocrispum wychmicini]|uniref:DUF6777 domain-containing protein n=1 Tax=Actinocrispum wychmicini TaxID=1213861 RepID=UPI00104BA712|nr:DUF6777 domain-containing protein [Actinocrispum wychmicini]